MKNYNEEIILLNGKLYKVLETYEGDKDLSYHGSPWYETFIKAQDLRTNEIYTFGDQTYKWQNAELYIKSLEDKIKKIKSIVGVSL